MKKILFKLGCFIPGLVMSVLVVAAEPFQEKHIAAGLVHSLYVDPDGNVWVWGSSGLSDDGNKRVPHRVMHDGKALFVNYDNNTSYVVRQDGSLWGWGNTDQGQLGIFPNENSASDFIGVPRKIMNGAIAVSGSDTIFAIRPDHSLWVWGGWGLPRGDTGRKDTITPKKIMNDVVQVGSVFAHTLALQKDGTLWAWGDNQCGALGTGDTKKHITPVKVDLRSLGKRKIVRIAVRWGESFILADDGTVWYSGEYNIRQNECLDPPHLVPTRLRHIDNVADIALGRYHELYLKKDASVWASGSGPAAASSTGYIDRPFHKVMDHVEEIAAGDLHSLVLKEDGTVWAWGDNRRGQLGDGTTRHSAVPVQVLFPDRALSGK